MGNIVLLDEHTINKIAAGEVVDRPASIVKELVENSIDAKATKITIEIKNGGISLIKITDNGIGFKSDDVEIAFERHATSKIRQEEDLQKIKSMGFRGEALASIAAISKVCLISKNIDEDIGMKAIVEAGKVITVEPSAAVQGTMIEIKDVFYNVPARFKFLKKDSTEASYIEDVITRMALSHPEVSFKYINNNKTIIQTSGKDNLQNTIYDIFGKEFYDNVIKLDYEYEGIKITGMIGRPVLSRSTRMHQFTFINTRYVKDKIISTAIDKACLQKYAIGKFTFIVLNLDLNPALVDVNVHPSKLEVKFENESKIFEAVYHSIKNALEEDAIKNSPFTTIRTAQQAEPKIEEVIKNDSVQNVEKEEEKANISVKTFSKATNSNDNVANKSNSYLEVAEEVFVPYKEEENKIDMFNMSNQKQNVSYVTEESISVNNETDKLNNYNKEKVEIITDVDKKIENNIFYKYIGQVFDTYIIIQIDEKMYIIDQHAAHERLLYEKIKSDYFSKSPSTQMLLIPIIIELTSKEKDIVDKNIDMFKNAGFDMEEFSDNTFKIAGVPNIGYDLDYKSLFKDMIDELLGANKTYSESKEERFIATLACKAAVKGRMKLSKEEQISLIEDMIKLDNPFNCPHGRPTAIIMSKYEIERKFLRK